MLSTFVASLDNRLRSRGLCCVYLTRYGPAAISAFGQRAVFSRTTVGAVSGARIPDIAHADSSQLVVSQPALSNMSQKARR